MADEYTTIGAFPEITTEPEGTHQVVIRKSTAPAVVQRISWANLKKWVLGNRVIGGSGVSDIVTNNASQIMTNKRINGLQLNSDGVTSATSEDLDKVADLQEVVRGDFINLSGTTGNIQAQINQNVVDIGSIEDYIDGTLTDLIQDLQNAIAAAPLTYTLEVGIGVGITSYDITEATIVSGLGLSAGTKLSHLVVVGFGQNTGSGYETSPNDNVVVLHQITGGVTHLSKVTFNVTAEKLFWFKIIVNRLA